MGARITVIIPARNEEKLIGGCLEALKKQTIAKEAFDILVVDNISTDKTAQIAKSFGARVVEYPQLKNAAAARNHGVKDTNAEILAFIDADSKADPDWLEKIDRVMQDKKIVCVAGYAVADSKNPLTRFNFAFYDLVLRAHNLFGIVLPWGLNIAIKKHAFEKVGGFDETLSTGEDWEIGLALTEKFGRGSVVYRSDVKALTSARKQENFPVFMKYLWIGAVNYWNIVILRKKIGGEAMTLR